MPITQERIKLAAKLYECHDTAKNLYKNEFFEKIKPYERLIKEVMKAKNLDETSAALLICKDTSVIENGMALMMLLATLVEMIEPSK